jgi:hypothetical protein
MLPPKSKVDLYAAIRRDARAGMSHRALMREYEVGFRTVKAALESVWPEPRKNPQPRGTRLDRFKSLIDQMLRAHLEAPTSLHAEANRYPLTVRGGEGQPIHRLPAPGAVAERTRPWRDSGRRMELASRPVRQRADLGNRRLHQRWENFLARKKNTNVATVAVARELAGWCWSLAVMED